MTDMTDMSNGSRAVDLLPYILVDFNSLNSAPVDRLKLGPAEGPDGDPDLARLRLARGQRVIFYDDEITVEGTVDYVMAHGVPYWLGDPDWSTRTPTPPELAATIQ
jgi:hypothetical protein